VGRYDPEEAVKMAWLEVSDRIREESCSFDNLMDDDDLVYHSLLQVWGEGSGVFAGEGGSVKALLLPLTRVVVQGLKAASWEMRY